MKILVVGPQFPDSFARNILTTLTTMGHEAVGVDGTRTFHHQSRLPHLFWAYVPKVAPALERSVFRGVVRAARELQPRLVLVTYGIMPPQIVRELRDSCAAKVACWFTDAITSLYRMYLVASAFDACFLKEPFLVRVLRDKLGLNTHYLPECCNPLWHRRVPLSEQDRSRYGCDLAAMGGLHYYRARMLEAFEGCDLKIWGRNCPSWVGSKSRKAYTHQYVAEEEKARALRAASIVVNTMNYAEIEGVNCCLFEAAGCGAFQIADDKPALAELFEPEQEIVTFRTQRELKEKVDYYLGYPEERQAIADRAYLRAHREHTYEIRLKTILRAFDLIAADQLPVANAEEVGAP